MRFGGMVFPGEAARKNDIDENATLCLASNGVNHPVFVDETVVQADLFSMKHFRVSIF